MDKQKFVSAFVESASERFTGVYGITESSVAKHITPKLAAVASAYFTLSGKERNDMSALNAATKFGIAYVNVVDGVRGALKEPGESAKLSVEAIGETLQSAMSGIAAVFKEQQPWVDRGSVPSRPK